MCYKRIALQEGIMRRTIATLAIGVFIGTAGVQLSAAIPTSPPTDGTPTGTIARVNEYLGNFLSKYAGATSELQFSGSQSWATNSNVATTMTSLGPQGASTTVSQWLTVVDNRGRVGFIPWYLYTP
jgi:hypothetical protein